MMEEHTCGNHHPVAGQHLFVMLFTKLFVQQIFGVGGVVMCYSNSLLHKFPQSFLQFESACIEIFKARK